MEIEYTTFSIRIPKALCDLAEAEATDEGTSRNHIITKALKERYKAHAPPNQTKSARSRALPRAKSKNKAEIS